MTDGRAPPGNLAPRVVKSYRLDEEKFRQIMNRLCEEVEKVAASSEAPERININPWLDSGEISVQGEYSVGDEKNNVFFDYVGRIVGGARLGKSGIYLQTFKPPEKCPLSARPYPNLLELLREYII